VEEGLPARNLPATHRCCLPVPLRILYPCPILPSSRLCHALLRSYSVLPMCPFLHVPYLLPTFNMPPASTATLL